MLARVGDAATQSIVATFIGIFLALTGCCCIAAIVVAVIAIVVAAKKRSTQGGRNSRKSMADTDDIQLAVLQASMRAAGSVMLEGSNLDASGKPLPAGWTRHFDEEENLSYYIGEDERGLKRAATWTKPQALAAFKILKDEDTDWSKVRRQSVARTWEIKAAKQRPESKEWMSSRDSETGRLFFTESATGRSTWLAPERIEFRIADDGIAYTRSQFEEHYGGTREWEVAEAMTDEVVRPISTSRYPTMMDIGATFLEDDEEEEEEEDDLRFSGSFPRRERVSAGSEPSLLSGRTSAPSGFDNSNNPLASTGRESASGRGSLHLSSGGEQLLASDSSGRLQHGRPVSAAVAKALQTRRSANPLKLKKKKKKQGKGQGKGKGKQAGGSSGGGGGGGFGPLNEWGADADAV